MTDTPKGEELLKAFSEWTELEEDLWIELYTQFCTQLMGARLDPEAPERIGRQEYSERFDACKEDLQMAAELADAAVEEMQVRFSIQASHRKQQRNKSKSAYQTRRGKRLESRK